MSETSREETQEKAGLAGAVETRLVDISAKIDRLIDRVETTATAAQRAEASADAAKAAAAATKWNILFTALGTIGVVVAIFALWMQGMDFVAGLIRSAP